MIDFVAGHLFLTLLVAFTITLMVLSIIRRKRGTAQNSIPGTNSFEEENRPDKKNEREISHAKGYENVAIQRNNLKDGLIIATVAAAIATLCVVFAYYHSEYLLKEKENEDYERRVQEAERQAALPKVQKLSETITVNPGVDSKRFKNYGCIGCTFSSHPKGDVWVLWNDSPNSVDSMKDGPGYSIRYPVPADADIWFRSEYPVEVFVERVVPVGKN